jgi:outer membrane lipoprotein-sorting protein
MKRFIFLSALITVVVFSAEMAPAQDLASLKEAFRNIRSVKAEFLQKRSLPILTKPLFSEGKLFFFTPDSLRWEYFTPLRSVMLRKGNDIRLQFLWVYGSRNWRRPESRRMVLAEISHCFRAVLRARRSLPLLSRTA